MRDSSAAHHIIYGAGAVGGTLGVLLHRAGRRVTLVGRPALADAVARQGGLRFIEAGRPELVPVEVVTDPAQVRPDGAPRVHFTMKAGDLAAALARARETLGAGVPVVTWQNGIRAEAAAHEIFVDLIGGIVRATSTMLTPGEVRIRAPGIMIIGRFPPRVDTLADEAVLALQDDLRAAGYDAVTSPDIRSDKALKLLVNLFSGAGPLVRVDGSPTPNLTRVECNIVREGARVLSRAGIRFEALSGRGDDLLTMLNHLATRPHRPPASDGVHNSTWQNLNTPGRRLENDVMNGEIVALARRHGEFAPWNARLLELLDEVSAARRGPEPWTDAEFGAHFEELAEPPPFSVAAADGSPPE